MMPDCPVSKDEGTMINGLRVLVVEDDPGISLDITDLIERAEGEVIGPTKSIRETQELLRTREIDAAILDVNLSDGDITPVLEALRAREVPVVIYSGTGLPERLSERHPDVIVLKKPVQPGRLLGELQRAQRNLVG